MENAEPEGMVQGIVSFLLHCTTRSSYEKDMKYVQYKHIVGYNDQRKLCRCTRHAERWQVLAATKLKIYQIISLLEEDVLLNMGVADRCLVSERTVMY